ncbi:MAG: hypothetical protein ACOYYS_26855 [Chloroflexota bacterium]
MDISFQDPNQIPLPPGEVRIQQLRGALYPDGRRVKVSVTLTPFQKRPSLSLEVRDALAQIVAETQVIETMAASLDLNLHLRHPDPQPPYTLVATLFYTPPIEPDAASLPERTVVDTASSSVSLP